MSQIPISTKGGLEPHLINCEICNGEVNGLTIGVLYKAQHEGQTVYADRDHKSKVNRQVGTRLDWTHVEEGEKVTMGLCDKCQQEIVKNEAILEAEIKKGGVHFVCEMCHCKGAIKAEHPLAIDVRAHTGIDAPAPVGVKFKSCIEHGAEEPINH